MGWVQWDTEFKKALRDLKLDPKSVIEFGLGPGTKFFVDKFEEVTSVEILEENDEWYEETKKMFGDRQNWTPILLTGKNQNIEKIVKDLFRKKKYDLAFVDPGVTKLPGESERGRIVNALFGKCDIIIADDTQEGEEEYGWNKIKTPKTYVEKKMERLTVWVKKKRK